MALSFEDEIRAFIKHRLEQQPAVQAATVGGERTISVQDSINYVGASLTIYQEAIILVAREIDTLRSASDSGQN